MAFTNVGSAEGEYASVSVLSQTLTVAVPNLAANSIGVVAVCVHVSTCVVTGITWDGAAMTVAESALNADGNRKVYLYYKANPADNGNKDVVVSFNINAVTFHIVAVYADAGGAVTLDDTSTETGSARNPDIVSTQVGANELVISASATDNNGPPTAPTGCTQLQGYDSGANCSETAYSIEASSGDATHTHNYTQDTASAYAIASASFQEAAAGGGSTTVAKHRGPYMVGMMHGMRKPGMQ